MSHTAADASEAGLDGRLALGPAATARAERVRAVLLVASFALLLLVGLALPHAAAPDLGHEGLVVDGVALGPLREVVERGEPRR